MRLPTILNRVHQIKGFVYGAVRGGEWNGDPALEVEVRARAGSRGICSGCGKKRPGYDRLEPRRFEFLPFWGLRVFLVYRMRRVACPRCGVKVEQVPWAEGKSETTLRYQWYLAGWAKRMSWQEVAAAFHTSWHIVCQAVAWGRAHLDLDGIQALGIDEMPYGRGHQYLTVVYPIDGWNRWLLWVGEKRTVKTLLRFFRWLGEERSARVRYVCSDMWKAYLSVVKKKAGQALHILDRFHIVTHTNNAVDEVRAEEARELSRAGQGAVLKRSRWLFLKRAENLTAKQGERLAEIVRHNLRTVRAYLLKEEFQLFWEYESPWWAGRFLDSWCGKTMLSRIEPMK